MRSTFMGLEASKRGLYTQQSALYTTGHNISNANTLGYTRQRVNFETTPGFPGSGLNSPTTAGHIGTGVQAHSIQRMRDEFVDRQFRQETNKLGYWSSTTKAISRMEDVMSEPSEFGINQAFTDFWKSMEDIIADPKDTAARQVFISKGQTLAESFNYMDTQLKQIQGNLGNEMKVVTDQANSLLKQIADLNKQIQEVEPNGYMPNDLYDARDVLLDKLNEIIPVTVSYDKSGGNALAIAEGSMNITYVDKAGNKIDLVKGKEYGSLSAVGPELDANGNPIKIDGDVDNTQTAGYSPFKQIEMTGALIKNPVYDPNKKDPNHADYDPNYNEPEFTRAEKNVSQDALEPGKGKLASLINSYGYADANGDVKGLYPDMLAQLDKLAGEFIQAFNAAHSGSETIDPVTGDKVYSGGFDLNGNPGNDFFSGTTARNMKVADGIKPENIAASDRPGEEGNNKNMIVLAKLQSDTQANLQGGTFQSFYTSLVGDLAVKGDQAATSEFNTATLHLQIEKNRASFNSVSLDEEMTNMITFQQAYNANARMITVIDETLDKIINGMGRVGL